MWRTRLLHQRDELQKTIAARSAADPKDFGDYIYRKTQDAIIKRLNDAIDEIDQRLAEPPEEEDSGDIGS